MLIEPFHDQNGAGDKEKSANELILAHLLPNTAGGEPKSAHLRLLPITLSVSNNKGLHLFLLMQGTIAFLFVLLRSFKEQQIEKNRKWPRISFFSLLAPKKGNSCFVSANLDFSVQRKAQHDETK
jgi:hypothetical protein